MKKTQNRLIKSELKIQETDSKTNQGLQNVPIKAVLLFDTLEMVIIALLSFVCVTAPFWHIFYKEGANDGVLGFSSMRSFLYTFGVHFALFGCAVFLLLVVNRITDSNKRFRTVGNIIGGGFCSVAVYYLLYVFITKDDPFPDYMYEIAFIVTSVVFSVLIVLVFRLQFRAKQKQLQEREASKVFIDTALGFIDEINHTIVK
jgi:cell shape-determining protein MreD